MAIQALQPGCKKRKTPIPLREGGTASSSECDLGERDLTPKDQIYPAGNA
jgi:hypothetical protein